jgi:hypothetical protein
MKKLILILVLLKFTISAQISNPSFEKNRDTLKTLPENWRANLKPQFKWQLDTTVFHSGKQSLSISNDLNVDSMVFSPFSQICPITIDKVKKIELTAFIKTKNVSKNVGLWCQLLDKDNKQIGFSSLETQGIFIKGNSEWTKYSVSLQVDTDVKKLLLGGFLKGTGQVWYDDFKIEDIIPIKSSKKATRFINEALKIAKNGSIVSDSINWIKTTEDLYALSAGAQTTKDCYSAINHLISVLRKKGDNHSGFYPPEFERKHKTENMNGEQPIGKYLGESIGYIEVPGFESVNTKICEDFATDIQNLIKKIDTIHQINYWIVDLRNNTGGNMYPMIAGLGPILGNETLGYFTSPKLRVEYTWEYKNGASMANGHKLCAVKNPYTLKNKPKKIIVLVGPNTASSGEMTSISFIGKENTTLIGLPTAGYSTGNAGHKLSDGSVLNLCESFCKDRNKHPIFGPIKPNEIINPIINNEEDNTLEYAKKQFLK